MSKHQGKEEQGQHVAVEDQKATDCENGVGGVPVGHESDDAGADAAPGKVTETASSADLSSVVVTLSALNSTLEAFGQALGDQASRVTAIEGEIGRTKHCSRLSFICFAGQKPDKTRISGYSGRARSRYDQKTERGTHAIKV